MQINDKYLRQSFPPLADEKANILILGSIPGNKSIELNEYYGHPQNRFWRMIAHITESKLPMNYDEKKNLLRTNNIAVWDVAHKAIRKGSMDSDIRDEEPNDINSFLQNHSELKVIAFNGKKAEQLYDRYFERLPHINYLSMPSTSPANATIKFEALCSIWCEATKY